MRMLDLFCGRWGWSRAFAARGWECMGVDLVKPAEIPERCTFEVRDIIDIRMIDETVIDFICASPPCEEFSKFGLKCFYPQPPYPELGIKLFNHTRQLCEQSGVPFVIENVRSAQKFVGKAAHHCGPFYLWGSGVPILVNQGILKNATHMSTDKIKRLRINSKYSRKEQAAHLATIPPELANCVADYAEWLVSNRKPKPEALTEVAKQ